MRALIAILAAVLVAAVAFAGWQLFASNREQEKLSGQVAVLKQEQERMRKTLSESQDSFAGANDKASLLMREDLQAASAMRSAVAEYYMSMVKMPATQAEAGLPAPESYRGKTLRSATVLPDGSIDLVFDAASGVDGGRVRFVADTSHVEAMGIQWHCVTSDYPLIKRVTPACEYEAPVSVAAPANP